MALSSTERTRRWRERHQKDETTISLELKQDIASFRIEIRESTLAILLGVKELSSKLLELEQRIQALEHEFFAGETIPEHLH